MQKTQNLQDAFLNYIRRDRSRSNCRADLPAAPRRKEGRI